MFRRRLIVLAFSLICLQGWLLSRPLPTAHGPRLAASRYHQRTNARRFAARSTWSYQRASVKPGMGTGTTSQR